MTTRLLLALMFTVVSLTGCGESGETKSLRQEVTQLKKTLADLEAKVQTDAQTMAELTKKNTDLQKQVEIMSTPAGSQITRPSSSAAKPPVRGEFQVYYYDVTTGEMFESGGNALPPIVRENGNQAYKAYIFTCGDCSNKDERFVGYYEGFTAEYKASREKAIAAAKDGTQLPEAAFYFEEGLSTGRLLSTDAKTWVTSDSPEGIAINVALSRACESKGGRLRPCYPGIK